MKSEISSLKSEQESNLSTIDSLRESLASQDEKIQKLNEEIEVHIKARSSLKLEIKTMN